MQSMLLPGTAGEMHKRVHAASRTVLLLLLWGSLLVPLVSPNPTVAVPPRCIPVCASDGIRSVCPSFEHIRARHVPYSLTHHEGI
jgi:hypothetical protein